jgi:hypothetical protein
MAQQAQAVPPALSTTAQGDSQPVAICHNTTAMTKGTKAAWVCVSNKASPIPMSAQQADSHAVVPSGGVSNPHKAEQVDIKTASQSILGHPDFVHCF